MAWNEPGKPGQDPWGGNRPPKKDGSQPDPVEQIRRQFEQFMGKVGQQGGGNGDGHYPTPQGMGKSIGVLAGVGFVAWMAFGIYIVSPAERGVVQVFGSFKSETAAGPHWNWPTPIGKVTKVNVEEIRNAEIGYRMAKTGSSDVGGESLMLTQDENIVDIKLAVQYNVRNAANYLFTNDDPDYALRSVIESALRSVVGKSKMDFVLTDGRAQLVAQVREQAQAVLDEYKTGIQITSVNLQDAQPPEQVQDAFADVVKAREDRQRLISEAEAYANDILPKARGQAARMTEEANAYREQVVSRAEGEAYRFDSILTQYQKAPEVTRQRMYLDTVESVLGNSSKIMVSSQSSGQMMYLPLDRWMQGEGNAASNASTNFNSLPEVSTNNNSSRSPASTSLRDNLRTREIR